MQISSMNRMILEIPPLFFVNNQTLAPHLTLEQLSSRCFPFPATCSSELLRPPAINPSSLLRVLVAAERSHHRQLSSLGFPLDQRLPRTIPATSSSCVHLRRHPQRPQPSVFCLKFQRQPQHPDDLLFSMAAIFRPCSTDFRRLAAPVSFSLSRTGPINRPVFRTCSSFFTGG